MQTHFHFLSVEAQRPQESEESQILQRKSDDRFRSAVVNVILDFTGSNFPFNRRFGCLQFLDFFLIETMDTEKIVQLKIQLQQWLNQAHEFVQAIPPVQLYAAIAAVLLTVFRFLISKLVRFRLRLSLGTLLLLKSIFCAFGDFLGCSRNWSTLC